MYPSDKPQHGATIKSMLDAWDSLRESRQEGSETIREGVLEVLSLDLSTEVDWMRHATDTIHEACDTIIHLKVLECWQEPNWAGYAVLGDAVLRAKWAMVREYKRMNEDISI